MRVTDNSTTNDTQNRRISSDTGPFAIIPEWLIDSPISDRGVRLYAILCRYADSDGYSWPSRSTLAKRLGRSVDSLDRAVKELVEAEVLEVEGRYDLSGDRTSNGYLIHRVKPARLQVGSRETAATGGRETAATGGRETAALTRTILNESHLELIAPPSDATKVAAQRKADVVWDTLMEVCGIDSQDITKASRGAYNRACADLKEIGATRDSIIVRATVFRRRWPGVSLTPTALARRWPECDPDHQHGTRAPLLPSEQTEMSALVTAWETK